ncbi:MAG: lyase family protein [Parvularcula sp.]|jgi:adenylosuccinate lyase|nr:lyase family protein [Parvularcula sp.]
MMTGIASALALIASAVAAPAAPASVEDVFTPENRNMLVMQLEAAIAEAQAEHGVVPARAAAEIRRKASLDYAPLDDIAEEYKLVRHRMVALLNVWRRSLSPEAQDALHRGVTTVDIYDTVRILQTKEAIGFLRDDMVAVEAQLVELAAAHRDTPMVGRTLGQHALPITFGKKVAVWAAANRRNIERLNAVECRLDTLGVLRGAVGTHLGLGPKGREIERQVSQSLGLGPTNPADWHGMRDVFAEYAAALAISSRVYAAIGEEVFLLQMTDIGEVHEQRPTTAVSSSTMPHKRNPSLSEALIHWGRVLPATAGILTEDVVNAFERDNTSRPNRTLEALSLDAEDMMDDVARLLDRLAIDDRRMAENLALTDGMILAQRLVLHLQDAVGKEVAETRVTAAAQRSMAEGIPFRASLLDDEVIAPHLADDLDELLDPAGYMGLSAEQVDATIAWLAARPTEPACSDGRN